MTINAAPYREAENLVDTGDSELEKFNKGWIVYNYPNNAESKINGTTDTVCVFG